jgi:hypothetical protein
VGREGGDGGALAGPGLEVVQLAAVGFQLVRGGGLRCGLQVGCAGGQGAIVQAREDHGDGGLGDVGVACVGLRRPKLSSRKGRLLAAMAPLSSSWTRWRSCPALPLPRLASVPSLA